MRPIIYFFGEMTDGVKSYPTDHTIDFFNDFIRRSRNELQIVLHRKDNLLYYSYIRKIQNNKSFGICIGLDCLYKDISRLFSIFDTIYSNLVEKGEILRFSPSGQITWATTNLAEESVPITEYSDDIIDQLGIGLSNTQALPPVNFSVSINDCLESSLESLDIVDAISKYSNIYIVKQESEIEKIESYRKTLSEKDAEITSLNQQVSELEENNRKLLRTKRNYKWVKFLSVLVAAGVVVILLFNRNVNELHGKISTQECLKDSLQTIINEQQEALATNEAKLSEACSRLDTISSFLSDVSNYVPLVVSDIEVKNDGENYGDIIYSSNTTYLCPRLTVYSLIEGTEDFYIKLYRPNGDLSTGKTSPSGYSFRRSEYITKNQKTTVEMNGWGGSDKGHWTVGTYKIEVWHNSTLLKSKSFTIY